MIYKIKDYFENNPEMIAVLLFIAGLFLIYITSLMRFLEGGS